MNGKAVSSDAGSAEGGVDLGFPTSKADLLWSVD